MTPIRMVTWLAPGLPLALFEAVREALTGGDHPLDGGDEVHSSFPLWNERLRAKGFPRIIEKAAELVEELEEEEEDTGKKPRP